jgi:hypothetical protein
MQAVFSYLCFGPGTSSGTSSNRDDVGGTRTAQVAIALDGHAHTCGRRAGRASCCSRREEWAPAQRPWVWLLAGDLSCGPRRPGTRAAFWRRRARPAPRGWAGQRHCEGNQIIGGLRSRPLGVATRAQSLRRPVRAL